MASEAATDSGERENPPESVRVGGFWNDIQTVPNLFSLGRIVIIVVTALLYLQGHRSTALLLGIFAGITDIFDGMIARKLNQVTELGAILDRLSDLVMETVAFAMLLHYRLVPPVLFIIYMVREYIVISARQYVAEKGGTIQSSFLGKRKTNLVMGSFVGLFASHSGLIASSEVVYKIGFAMLIGGLVCSYISGAQYLRTFVQIYGDKKP
jgi:cardiolipin synthase